MTETPLITNDAVVLGILISILAFVFWSSGSEKPGWKRFYGIVPSLLLCYFIPSVIASLGIISGDHSQLYTVASRYLLPASLVLLTISLDLPAVLRLGPKALVMFLTGTFGVMIGGPIALLLTTWVAPGVVGGEGPDAVWRGLTTIAGSWIGGGANQAALKEVFGAGDDLFSVMIAVDVVVANVWMAFLLYCAGNHRKIDAWTGANTTAIEEVRSRVETYQASVRRIPALGDTMMVLAAGLGVTALAHLGADLITPPLQTTAETQPLLRWLGISNTFFWIVLFATIGGLVLSFTRARQLEGVGASRIGSAFLYVLVATIGMKMNILAVFDNPSLFLVGGLWMAVHAGLMLAVAWWIKAPVFFMAVGSQANIGGAASAPIVATAFHPALAPVGVLLAILGYVLGTLCGWLSGLAMQAIAGG